MVEKRRLKNIFYEEWIDELFDDTVYDFDKYLMMLIFDGTW